MNEAATLDVSCLANLDARLQHGAAKSSGRAERYLEVGKVKESACRIRAWVLRISRNYRAVIAA